MENFIDFDQASCEKSCTPLCQHLNEMYWEKRASDSSIEQVSSERPPFNKGATNVSILSQHMNHMLESSRMFSDRPANFGIAVTFERNSPEEPCKALEGDDGCQEINDTSTDHVEPNRNSDVEYKNICSDENDKIFGDMFTSSEEG